MNRDLELSVVVPVYKSAATLQPLVGRLKDVLAPLCADYEILLVNDGSPDHSWNVIGKLERENSKVAGIDLLRNYGQHNALLCGIRRAKYPVIVTMDDDLQHPPEEIPKLLRELSAGHDVVYGTPEQEQHGLWRDMASVVTKIVLQGTMGAATARKITAFRAFKTEIREAFDAYRGPFVCIDVLLAWGTSRFSSVVVRHDPRREGQANYTFMKLLTHAFNMVTGFSTLPLQLASVIGFSLTVFGACVLAYVVGRYLIQGTTVPGFPFLASVIAIFSGAQLFALGIIGEYLARMYFRMMDRPTYAVRARTPAI